MSLSLHSLNQEFRDALWRARDNAKPCGREEELTVLRLTGVHWLAASTCARRQLEIASRPFLKRVMAPVYGEYGVCAFVL